MNTPFYCYALRILLPPASLGWMLAGMPTRAQAVMGVGDIVVLADDRTDLWKWPREKAQWDRVNARLASQEDLAQELVDLAGDPASASPAIVGNTTELTSPVAMLVALESRQQALNRNLDEASILDTPGSAINPANRVESRYHLLGSEILRDSKRYEHVAQLETLQERQTEAVGMQEEVVAGELKEQKRLLERLHSARTHAALQAAHAAIAASQQRLELARQKADQARDETLLLETRLRTENERKRASNEEWAEAFIEKLRQRALTSLHAQQGENS
jgi:hypothetical protein